MNFLILEYRYVLIEIEGLVIVYVFFIELVTIFDFLYFDK